MKFELESLQKLLLVLLSCLLFTTSQSIVRAQTSCDYVVNSAEELEEANSSAQTDGTNTITICLMSADYGHVSIHPEFSGDSEDSQIIYKPYSEEKVTLNEKIDLGGKSFITVSGIDIELHSDTWTHRYADLRNSNNITIENSNMTSIPEDKPNHCPVWMDNTSYSILRNNRIEGNNSVYNDLVQITGDSHHNLIEHNRLSQGSHTLLLISGEEAHHNIVRNNHFKNDYHHCTGVGFGASNNVFGNNILERCGYGQKSNPDAYYPNYASGDWHAWQDEGIYRYNIILNSGQIYDGEEEKPSIHAVASNYDSDYDGTPESIATVRNNRFYHNIIYGNHGLGIELGLYIQEGQPIDGYRDNKFVNNILYNNGETDLEIKYVHYGGASEVRGDVWRNNLIGDIGKEIFQWIHPSNWDGTDYPLWTLDEVKDQDNPDFNSGNISINPNFVNIIEDITGEWGRIDPSSDFHLMAGSPAIDGGDFLTYTTSSGSGNQVLVTDARFFIDGFGIVNGDTVQIGSEIVTVTHIDYEANTLTVNRAIFWDSGAGVSFPYSKLAPDIGAYEYLGDPTLTTSQLLLSWLTGTLDQNGDNKVNGIDFGWLVRLQ